MILNYNDFKKSINEGKTIDIIGQEPLNKLIDQAYNHFKKTKQPINTLDILNYIEMEIGKELDDDDYELLYYKITGDDLDSDEIFDLEYEEKFIVK